MTRKLIADTNRLRLVNLIEIALAESNATDRPCLLDLLREFSGVDKRLTVETAGPDWKHSMGQRIERLYAWVAEEADGGEGIVAGKFDGLGWTPLIGADKDRIESYRDSAEDVGREMGLPVRLKVFGEGIVIDEIKP